MAELTLAVRRGDEAQWVLGTASRREARVCAAREISAPGWTLRVVAATVRPISRAQCAASGHPAEHCVCWCRGEDWYQLCEPVDPGACVAWRIEPRAAVRRWRALRGLRARIGRARRGPGGYVDELRAL